MGMGLLAVSVALHNLPIFLLATSTAGAGYSLLFFSAIEVINAAAPAHHRGGVATADIGRLAAALLQETWTGRRIVELEGPRRITPNQIAATFAKILGRPVRMESQGMKNPAPRAQMLDGFNEGWIEFENGEHGSLKGQTEIETVLRQLVARG